MQQSNTTFESKFSGIYEGAFANPLKTRQYDGFVDDEVATQVWYKLTFDEAKRFIKNDEYTKRKIEKGNERPGSWLKLITTEYRNTKTGEIRRSWSTSLRPYIQGYGCDGTTDPNIHAIANRLASNHGLDYGSLLARAYPKEFSVGDDFSWLADEVVMAETIIPEEIDPDLALRDLEQINNYTLAQEFGIELYRLGVTSKNWVEIKELIEAMTMRIRQGEFDW